MHQGHKQFNIDIAEVNAATPVVKRRTPSKKQTTGRLPKNDMAPGGQRQQRLNFWAAHIKFERKRRNEKNNQAAKIANQQIHSNNNGYKHEGMDIRLLM